MFAPYTSITTNILFFDRTGATQDIWFYRLDMPEGYKNFSKTNPMLREHFKPVDEWWDNRAEIQDANETWKSKKFSAEEILANGCNLDLCGYPTEEKIILSPEDTMRNFINRRNELDKKFQRLGHCWRFADETFRRFKAVCFASGNSRQADRAKTRRRKYK